MTKLQENFKYERLLEQTGVITSKFIIVTMCIQYSVNGT